VTDTAFTEDQNPAAVRLLPAATEPLSADEELAVVSQVVERSDPEALVVVEPQFEPPPIGTSWSFDHLQGRYASGPGGHAPIITRGIATLVEWIKVALLTERGQWPIHSDQFGRREIDEAIGEPMTAMVALEEHVREALIFHPRIVDVTDFEEEDPSDDDQFDGIRSYRFVVVLDDGSRTLVQGINLG
jgi:hypothetical protein